MFHHSSFSHASFKPTSWRFDALITAGAGGGSAQGQGRRKRPRFVVEIDGEEFAVGSEAEAYALLANARAEAEALADRVTERAIAAARRPKRKVLADARKALAMPDINVPSALQAEASRVLAQIEEIYNAAMRAIEIGALMRLAEERDDEDVLLLML